MCQTLEKSSSELLFSVLVANYNNGEFIEETVESLRHQTYKNIEIVIVDDGSTDNSIKIIENLQKIEPRIKLYKNQSNSGCGYTKAKCVEYSKGEICGFVDPEDTLSNRAIELVVLEHNKFEKASIVFSNYYHCDEKLNVLSLKKPGVDKGKVNFSQLYERKINHFTTFKRSKYMETGGIDYILKRAIDQDLYIKLEEVGDVVYLDENLYYYRYHQNGISAFGNNYKALYWYMLVKKATCERRNLEQEVFFANEYEVLVNTYKGTYEYKVGSLILSPLKYFRSLMLRLSNKI